MPHLALRVVLACCVLTLVRVCACVCTEMWGEDNKGRGGGLPRRQIMNNADIEREKQMFREQALKAKQVRT